MSKVSICIPLYNPPSLDWLDGALKSAADQTFTDREIIVCVDKNGPDDTAWRPLLYKYCDEAGVKLFENSRRFGLPGNWNECVRRSSGEWIKFIFQDDWLDPTCIEELLEHEKEAPLISCKKPGGYFSPQDMAAAVARWPIWNSAGEPTFTLYKRTVFPAYGFFNEHLIQLSDWEMAARIATNTGIFFHRRPLATIRLHENSATSRNLARRKFWFEQIDPLIMHYELLKNPFYTNVRAAAVKSRVSLEKRFEDNLARARLRARIDAAAGAEWSAALSLYPEFK